MKFLGTAPIPATLALIAALLHTQIAHAVILPYTTRLQDYSSWTPAARGDINTIGMSGATLALPTSISAAEANSAGYAMLTSAVSAQINQLSLNDRRLQRSGDLIDTSQWGLSVSPEGLGLGFAYYSPMTESGIYASPNTGDTAKIEVSIKEFRLTAARAFLDDALALGLSLELVKAVRELNEAGSNAFAMSYRLGALYRLPKHVLLGVSFSPEVKVGPASQPEFQNAMPGFNRSVVRPLQFGLGLGWMPNRFFKLGFSANYVGLTKNTALLADQSVSTGAAPTWVPRFGTSYVLAEFPNFKMEAAMGTYHEISRLSDYTDRAHLTFGVEANPYFVNVGAGFDISTGYQNFMVSVGIDLVRTARYFDIIPKDPVPTYNGFWPRLAVINSDGLPPGLTSDERQRFKPVSVEDVGKIVEEVPENISKKVSGKPTTVEIKEQKLKKRKK